MLKDLIFLREGPRSCMVCTNPGLTTCVYKEHPFSSHIPPPSITNITLSGAVVVQRGKLETWLCFPIKSLPYQILDKKADEEA